MSIRDDFPQGVVAQAKLEESVMRAVKGVTG